MTELLDEKAIKELKDIEALKKLKGLDRIRKARELADTYKEQMTAAQELALDQDMKLSEIEAKLKAKKLEIEAKLHADIAESGFDEAKNLKQAGDEKEAEEIVAEIRDILDKPPSDEDRKRDILAEIDELFPESGEKTEEETDSDSQEGKADSEEKTEEDKEPTLGEKLKVLVDKTKKEFDAKRFSQAYITADKALKLAENAKDGPEKDKAIEDIKVQRDAAAEQYVLGMLAVTTKMRKKSLAKQYLMKTRPVIDSVTEETMKGRLEAAYEEAESEIDKLGEEESDGLAAGEEEDNQQADKEQKKENERTVPADVKELIEKNIFMSEDRIGDALKLVTNDATDKEGLEKYSPELEKAMEDLIGDVKGLLVKAGDDENKIDDIKRAVRDRLTAVDYRIDDIVRNTPADDRNAVFVKMQLPVNDQQREVYFLLKLKDVIEKLNSDIEKLK